VFHLFATEQRRVTAMSEQYALIPAPARVDDFQLAAAEAKAEAGVGWLEMPVKEQARAIYVHLRRIDAQRASTAFVAQGGQETPSETRDPIYQREAAKPV
jgi:hypothetical protein